MLFFWNNKECRAAVTEIGLKIGKDFFFDICVETVLEYKTVFTVTFLSRNKNVD